MPPTGHCTLTAPLPTDRASLRAILNAACLELWGASHWTRTPRPGKRLPTAWQAQVARGSELRSLAGKCKRG